MRRFLFFLALIFTSACYSQTINPFKLNNIEWFENGAAINSTGTGANYWSNHYLICGDTIYNDTLYKKMYHTGIYNPTQSNHTYPPFSFYCFFKQDTLTKSNYYRMPNYNKDSLLCSYNLNVGDTLKRGSYFAYSYSHPVVIATDSTTLYGRKFKIYYTDTSNSVTYCQKTYKGMFLIEGLGHCFGIFSGYVAPFESSNNVAALAFDTVCSQLQTASIKNIQIKNELSVYPNPSTGNFVVETNNQEEQMLQVFDVNGRLILKQNIKGSATINATDLPNGVYNVSIINSGGVINKRIIIGK